MTQQFLRRIIRPISLLADNAGGVVTILTAEAGAGRLDDAGHVLNFCPNLSERFCPI